MNNVEEYILLTVWFCFDFILFSHRFSFSFDLSCICFENLHHQLRWSRFSKQFIFFFFRTVDSWIKFYYLKEMKGKTIVFLLLSIMPGDVEADTADEICKERLISSCMFVCVFGGEGEMKPRGFCNRSPFVLDITHRDPPPLVCVSTVCL